MELIINLKRLRKNVEVVRSKTTAKFCAVIKSNAYGHGAKEVVNSICDLVDFFAVANCEEALEICEHVNKDVLVLSGRFDGRFYPDNVIFSALDVADLSVLNNARKKFAIKINTGMNRLGISSSDFNLLVNEISLDKIHSVYSHVGSMNRLKSQFQRLESCKGDFIKHICAGNFLSAEKKFHLDAVRCGLPIYGYGMDGLYPVMSVCADIVKVFDAQAGDYIGYGDFSVKKNCRIATVSVGYGDGFLRKRKPDEERVVVINGVKCPVVGQICMDLCMVDVTEASVKVGDKAWIICDSLKADEVAVHWRTITYEVLTQLSHARGVVRYIK